MKIFKIPKWVADEVDEIKLKYYWWGTLEFHHHGITSGEFDIWMADYENNIDILLAYLNPLTTVYVEVVE